MKEKMLQAKEYVIAHKKQIIIGVGIVSIAIIGGKALIKKLQTVEVSEDTSENIFSEAVNMITEKEEV